MNRLLRIEDRYCTNTVLEVEYYRVDTWTRVCTVDEGADTGTDELYYKVDTWRLGPVLAFRVCTILSRFWTRYYAVQYVL